MNNKTSAFLRAILTVLSAVLLSMPSSAHEHLKLSKAQKDSLRNELQIMFNNDQKYRWMVMLGEMDSLKLSVLRNLDEPVIDQRMRDVFKNRVGIPQAQKDSLNELIDIIDVTNFHKISSIITKYGFPKKYFESYKSATIIQHNALSLLTEDFLEILFEEVLEGNMPGIEFANLHDKVQEYKKLPMLYCVVETYDPTTKTSSIKPPADIEKTNAARKKIGLKKFKVN